MRKLLVFLLTLTIAFGMSVPASAANTSGYTDVPDTHWAATSIKNVTDKGIMQGYDGKFDPEGTLTRAQVAQVCYNAYAAKLPATTDKTLVDVPKDAWYHDATYWLFANDIESGTAMEDGIHCYPSATADRKYVALVLYRLANKLGVVLPQTSTAVTFSDINELAPEYQKAIGTLQQAGIIAGFLDGTYKPNNPLARSQAAKLFDMYTDIEGLKLAATSDPDPIDPATLKGSLTIIAEEYGFKLIDSGSITAFTDVQNVLATSGGYPKEHLPTHSVLSDYGSNGINAYVVFEGLSSYGQRALVTFVYNDSASIEQLFYEWSYQDTRAGGFIVASGFACTKDPRPIYGKGSVVRTIFEIIAK